MIPNPAPLEEGEPVRERVDEETDEDIWYIGDQAYIGPTDKEKWADEAPQSTIALHRIQLKNQKSIMRIPGVHSFGIGETGFTVSLDPDQVANESQIPVSIDNVPVEVILEEAIETWGINISDFVQCLLAPGFLCASGVVRFAGRLVPMSYVIRRISAVAANSGP